MNKNDDDNDGGDDDDDARVNVSYFTPSWTINSIFPITLHEFKEAVGWKVLLCE